MALDIGEIPCDRKLGIIVSIQKKRDAKECRNYRRNHPTWYSRENIRKTISVRAL